MKPTLVLSCLLCWPGLASANELTLDAAIEIAQQGDPWLAGNQLNQQALEDRATAAGTLPDPKVGLGLANLPVDSWDFAQEPMTQAQVSVSQMFPRGRSLALQQQQLQLSAEALPFARQDRKAQVAAEVSERWWDIYLAQESQQWVKTSRTHFEQLAELAETRYASAIWRTRQQDLVNAQVELSRLDDRLLQLNQQQQVATERLAEWFRLPATSSTPQAPTLLNDATLVASGSPHLRERTAVQGADDASLAAELSQHPAIRLLDQKVEAMKVGAELAEQKYQPEWGVSAGYGYRANDPRGMERSDFLSVGITFDLPIFTANRQDREVKAAVADTEALRTDRLLLLRRLIANYRQAQVLLDQLIARQRLYDQQILPQLREQIETELAAYTHDEGDFQAVMRARIAELNAQIELLGIRVEGQKVLARLAYLETKTQVPESTTGDAP
ncbi:MAG: TolC family protein [Hahellaceae bacterium]|nr:TolC family protein [Hahellaceae bacterium]